MTNFYLKHPTSDEMSEFTTINFGAMMQIRITHFVNWGPQLRAHVVLPVTIRGTDTKVVEIDQAREIWRMLVAQGFAREIGTEAGNRIQACKSRIAELNQQKLIKKSLDKRPYIAYII